MLATCLAPRVGRAVDDTIAQAKLHELRARKLFKLARFGEAARHYEQAYELKPIPALLYNLGQCYMRLGTAGGHRKAVHHFEAYLRDVPRAANREAVEAQIARIQRHIAQRQQADRPAEPGASSLPADRPAPKAATAVSGLAGSGAPALVAVTPAPFYKRWWFWTLVSAAVVGSAVAVGLAMSSGDSRVPAGPRYDWSSFSLRAGTCCDPP